MPPTVTLYSSCSNAETRSYVMLISAGEDAVLILTLVIVIISGVVHNDKL